jgi:uroporphyrinogen III methyltransferase/synthase
VVRLKGGDPFLFGRGGEEAAALAQAGIAFEVVPGVTSALAGPAYAGIPVTHRELGSMVAIVTGHLAPGKEAATDAVNFSLLADPHLTVVFLMSLGRLRENMDSLIRAGRPPDTPCAVVSRATWPAQQTLAGTLGDIAARAKAAELHAPAVVVVGEVARLHAGLKWFESRPLRGRRIVLTRPAHKSQNLARRLESLGAEPLLFPTIEIRFLPLDNAMRAAMDSLALYDWIAFTSATAVEAFMRLLEQTGRDARALGGLKIAAVGPATAEALAGYRLLPDLVPPEFSSGGLAAALGERQALSQRILFPCAREARGDLPSAAAAAGGRLDPWVLYETAPAAPFPPETFEAIQRGEYDGLVFASPSAARNFYFTTGVNPALDQHPAFCLGPATHAALGGLGHRRIVRCDNASEDAVVAAVLGHFKAP